MKIEIPQEYLKKKSKLKDAARSWLCITTDCKNSDCQACAFNNDENFERFLTEVGL